MRRMGQQRLLVGLWRAGNQRSQGSEAAAFAEAPGAVSGAVAATKSDPVDDEYFA
jgi:hypothetical protein